MYLAGVSVRRVEDTTEASVGYARYRIRRHRQLHAVLRPERPTIICYQRFKLKSASMRPIAKFRAWKHLLSSKTPSGGFFSPPSPRSRVRASS